VRPRFELLESRRLPATFTVTGLGDNEDASDGQFTLREAIVGVNKSPGADTIDFAVTGTIAPHTALPKIIEPMVLDV